MTIYLGYAKWCQTIAYKLIKNMINEVSHMQCIPLPRAQTRGNLQEGFYAESYQTPTFVDQGAKSDGKYI